MTLQRLPLHSRRLRSFVKTVPTAVGAIECLDFGDGPAILAIHGGMGGYDQSLLLARSLLADLEGHRVVAVSRPGYLGTPLSVGATPDQQAGAYAALLDSLGIADAAVVAVSAGGPSALQLAALYPERCRALVLVSTCTGRLETPPQVRKGMGPMRILARIPGLPSFLKWRTSRHPEKSAARSIRDPALRERTLADPDAGPLLRALQTSIFGHMAGRLPGTLNDIEQYERLEQLPRGTVRAPTLIIHGDGDTVVPFSHALAVQVLIPQAELLAIPGGEHVALFTHLQQVRAAARGYLSG